MTETLVARTTRAIWCEVVSPGKSRTVLHTERVAAGTEVYAHPRRDGRFNVRVPGSRLTSTVPASALDANA